MSNPKIPVQATAPQPNTLAGWRTYAKAKEQELEDFKQRVVSKATEMGEEHGFCAEMDAALEDLGLEPQKNYVVTVTLTLSREIRGEDIDHAMAQVDDQVENMLADGVISWPSYDGRMDHQYHTHGDEDYEWEVTRNTEAQESDT